MGHARCPAVTRLIAIAAVMASTLPACAEANGDAADASASAVDADPSAPDADPSAPDADPNAPDADPSAPDATVTDAMRAADAARVDSSTGLDSGVADASSPPDAAAPDAMPCTPSTWKPLLANGDFESGNTVWTKVGNGGNVIKQNGSLPFNAQGGTWAAHLVGFNSADQTLSQSFTVPASATAMRLRGYKCYVSTEPMSTTAYDILTFELRNAAGSSVLETLDSISNLDIGGICSWTSFEYTAASAHAGQSITLALHGISDSLSLTSFVVDTMVLEAFACP